jgi:hypothetical protein
VRWLLFVSGALATFRLSHLVSKERGPLCVFERIRNALPRGRGWAQDWLSCIFCFSLSASAAVCVLLWASGLRLTLQEWIIHGFSAVALILINGFASRLLSLSAHIKPTEPIAEFLS